MSHPNPYLFQINRTVLQACRRMDISTSTRSYLLQDVMEFKDAFIMFRRVELYYLMYERVLLYKIFIRSIFMLYILMYPVLNLMHILNFLDTFSVGVTTNNQKSN